jgi:hypothetical protein
LLVAREQIFVVATLMLIWTPIGILAIEIFASGIAIARGNEIVKTWVKCVCNGF